MTYDSRVTIGDVAARAGVSIATVSRVVNGRYGVAEATVARVRDIVSELGYESSLVARSLRSQRTNVIAVLVSGIEPFSAELLKGAAQAVEDTGFELIVYSGGQKGQPGWERRHLARLSGTLADGTILVAPTVLAGRSAHPIVSVDPHVGGSTQPVVESQNFEGALAATRHLLELGHRRIAFLGGRSDLESARRREAGYRSAHTEAGVAVDDALIAEGNFTESSAVAPAHHLLTLADRPTAVFAANDLMALQVLRAANELGLRVPTDVSVVGFDNIPEAAMADPPLTTVDQHMQALGREAVRVLVDLIEHPDRHGEHNPIHVTLPTELVVRRSTSAPPAPE